MNQVIRKDRITLSCKSKLGTAVKLKIYFSFLDVIALASAINELTHFTCKLRTSLWCALQIMLSLSENSANISQKSDLFYKLNDDSIDNNLSSQIKLLQINDNFNNNNRSASFIIDDNNQDHSETGENYIDMNGTEIRYKNASII